MPGTTFIVGKEGHLEVSSTGPGDEWRGDIIIAQWCFPSRRQHDGRLESGPEEDSAGPIDDTPRTVKRSVADKRCTEP